MLPNYVLFSFFGLEGLTNPLVADIVTTGFLPGWLFDAITEEGDGSQYILGVTFTLIWVDGNGDPSDVNNDGYADTALKEVWYNDTFAWSTDGTRRTIDIETVALHENGHALELGHFGKISETIENGKFHFSPRTVMNASYSGIQREVEDIANAAHCSQFGSWPNN